MTKTRYFWGGAVAGLLLMAALLIPGLNDESLWGDEGWSVRFSEGSAQDVVAAVVEDRHPPLYFLMLNGWRHLAGDGVLGMRFLATCHALLTGALLFQLGRYLFSPLVGLLVVLVLALMDQHAVWAREVRHYPLLLMWMVASWVALLRWATVPQARGRALIYVSTLIGGLYTHNFMLLIIATQLAYILLVQRTRWWGLVRLNVLAGVAFLPWALVFVYQFMVHGGLRHDWSLDWATTRLLTDRFLGTPAVLGLGLIGLALLSPLVNAPGWSRWRPSTRTMLAPIVAIILPMGIIIGLTLFDDNTKLFTDRNLAIILPWLALLMAVGMTAFQGFARGALVAFLVINGVVTVDIEAQNPPWREIARFVADHQVQGQPVFIDVFGSDPAFRHHLSLATDARPVSIFEMERAGQDVLTQLRFVELEATTGGWYVIWGDRYHDALPGWGFVQTDNQSYPYDESQIDIFRYDAQSLLTDRLVRFGEASFHLHQIEFPAQGRTDDAIPVSFWWSLTASTDMNYSVSVGLLNHDGQLIAQHDGYPHQGEMPTALWEPGQLVYDYHSIDVPPGLPPGDYQLFVRLYNAADGSILEVDGETLWIAGTITLTPS